MRSNTKLMKALKKKNACWGAMEWLAGVSSMQEAYDKCERGDWLLWLAVRLNIDHKLIVLAACECAEQALKYVPKGEDRPRKAIETARAWVRGEATLDEVRDAADAADVAVNAAADAADVAVNATADAADVAVNAAADVADVAVNATADAADVAVNAAADAAAYAAADAARAVSLKESANIVRKHIPFKLFKEAL